MSTNYNQYFTTSEFAKVCGVTKHTLFHYDAMGILKPEIVKENGYRYYSAKQFYTFDTIALLKETGTALQKIKEYMEDQNTIHFISMLKEKQKQLDDEQKKLLRMQRLLKGAIDNTNRALQMKYEEPWIEENEEEYFLAVKLSKVNDEKEHVKNIYQIFDYCDKHQIDYDFPIGSIVNKDNLENGSYEPNYYCNKINDKHNSELLYIKPKGNYVIMIHKGSYDSLPATYEKIKSYVECNNFTIIGNAYEYELLSYLAVGDPNKYVIQIAIQINK
ncbi:MerR family transcriptional regulator [Paenibacillus sp. GSMTC-2017]|uniref:MerR family transcriptional regulator n=1 Tax=Paenibacillus sp. GSMTC-2017 TaxID=2794350 RepID=UPI0018D79A82|nr:MerR family transcriptional regulator [Paenibacillus sp. GSMTC-2017]MBH5316246.1 MerR family transcriptional regulator [Paenibacillus sp. GSMTC-2017]